MKRSIQQEILKTEVRLKTHSVALGALTDSTPLAGLLPPGMDSLDLVIRAQKPRFDDPEKRERIRDHFVSIIDRLDGPESARRNAASLTDPNTFLVITGQQAGLLTGPLYTILKIATAISTARKMSRDKGVRAVPCFWCASEDADFDEVNHLCLLDPQNHVACCTAPENPPADTPVSAVRVSPALWESVERFLKTNLRETEFRPEVLRRLKDTFDRSKTWSEWMVRILWDLFPDDGLLITLPEDGFYQRECVEIFEKEIEFPQATALDLQNAAETLRGLGLHPQIHKKEDLCSFYLFRDGRRKRVEWEDGAFKVDGENLSPQDMAAILRTDPGAFGASAALRPVCQDAAFPVLASVLGPGEIGYCAQIGEVYKRHGVPRPAYLPRLSVTLFPSRFLDQLKETGLDPTDLKSPVEEVIKKTVGAKNTPAVQDAIANLRGQVETSFDTLGKEGEALDLTMGAALERSEKRIEEIIRQVEDLFTRRAAAADKTLKNRLNTMSNWFFPNGEPQERVLNVFQFLNSYGSELICQFTGLELDTTQGHFLIPLE